MFWEKRWRNAGVTLKKTLVDCWYKRFVVREGILARGSAAGGGFDPDGDERALKTKGIVDNCGHVTCHALINTQHGMILTCRAYQTGFVRH